MLHNGIVYSVNDNDEYIAKMVNSINSLFHFSKGLIDNTTVFVLTDSPDSVEKKVGVLIDDGIKFKVIGLANDEYADCCTGCRKRYTKHIHYRFELFRHPELVELDNSLYIDCDTDFNDTIEELFVDHSEPTIHLVVECENPLRDRRGNSKVGGLNCSTYYNSGFVFMTPKLIGVDMLKSLFDQMSRLPLEYEFEHPDQDALNVVLDKDEYSWMIKPLPKTYNYSCWTKPRSSAAETMAEMNYKMKHYGGGKKYEKRFLNSNS